MSRVSVPQGAQQSVPHSERRLSLDEWAAVLIRRGIGHAAVFDFAEDFLAESERRHAARKGGASHE